MIGECKLEVMSPHPMECLKTGRARIVTRYANGTALIALIGRTGVKFTAWQRPGGAENDFVCGSLAPGEPPAHPNRTARTAPASANKKDAA